MQLNELPQEILERIFSFTSQYTDYLSISQVCLKWNGIIEGLRILNKITFLDCLENGKIYWRSFENKFSPAQRHSHSSCRVDNMLYVFGGLSGTSTSYNDLWLFDLSQKEWKRPICNGFFPSPKAAATLVPYGKRLLLYGGYSHPYSYLHQQVSFFDEMHVFCTVTSQWSQVMFSQEAPKLAGHTSSIINGNKMLLFGGCNGSLGNKTNAVYCMDLVTLEWEVYPSGNTLENNILREVDGAKPECRYGHSQITLDDERVLIVGGCGGPNKQYDDLWILHWPKDQTKHASWQQVIVNNVINSPAQVYCISFVRYGNKLVTFGKPRIPNTVTKNETNKLAISNPFIGQSEENESNVYTLAGPSKEPQIRKCSCLSLSVPVIDATNLNHVLTPNEAAASQPSNNIPPIPSNQPTTSTVANSINNLELPEDPKTLATLNKTQRNTIRRLEALEKVASMFKPNEKATTGNTIKQQLSKTASLTKTRNQCLVHSKSMQMFVLNIDDLIRDTSAKSKSVSWQTPIVEFPGAPLDTILYTLNKGIDEIILFGGMEMESSSIQKSYENVKHRVSSRLYIMKPDSLFISSG